MYGFTSKVTYNTHSCGHSTGIICSLFSDTKCMWMEEE